jgi:hypothetical protein
VEVRSVVDLRCTAVRVPAPNGRLGADELSREREGVPVGFGEQGRRAVGEVCKVPFERAATDRVEVDPARARRRVKKIGAVRPTVERPFRETERFESRTELV